MSLLIKLHGLDRDIRDVERLKSHLQVALELEMATLPPYLCALYSIPDGSNVEVAGLIRSVMMEEMLHIMLVANVLNGVRGSPVLAKKGVKAALHFEALAVAQRLGPGSGTPTELASTLDQVHDHPSFSQHRRRSDSGDPTADDDRTRPRGHVLLGCVRGGHGSGRR